MKMKKITGAAVACGLMIAACSNAVWAKEAAAALEGTLTISSFYVEYQTQHMIDQFMEENPGVEIVVNSVFDTYPTSGETEEGMNVLATELISGSGADLYETTYISDAKFMNSGYFEDINPYIEADPEFRREDYYDNILRACESDGVLYQFPEGFYYYLIRLNKRITDQLDYDIPAAMSYKDIYDLFSMAKDAGLVQEDFVIESQNYLQTCLNMAEWRRYIDAESRKAELDSQEHIDFLSAVQEMYPYRSGNPLVNFADNRNLVSSDGELPFMRVGGYWSISAASNQKELAWEFIKFCVKKQNYEFIDSTSPDYYRKFFSYGAMINRDNTHQLAEFYLGNDEGTIKKWEDMSSQAIAKAFMDMPFEEQLHDFYYQCLEGELSPEECAAAMQQRAEIYMNE